MVYYQIFGRYSMCQFISYKIVLHCYIEYIWCLNKEKWFSEGHFIWKCINIILYSIYFAFSNKFQIFSRQTILIATYASQFQKVSSQVTKVSSQVTKVSSQVTKVKTYSSHCYSTASVRCNGQRARLECGRSWVHRWGVMVSVLASGVVDRGFIGGM